MKANHNAVNAYQYLCRDVLNIRISKNESKSQLNHIFNDAEFDVLNIRISKNESKSQLASVPAKFGGRCSKYQDFKE